MPFHQKAIFFSAFALQQSFALSSSNPFFKNKLNVSKVMTPVNNVIRLDNKHQLTYNSWGKGWDKEVPVFHLSISNSQYTQAFSENDYRAFDTAEFLLNLKQWVCSHAETGFIKLTKVRTAHMRFSNIGNIQKEEKKHLTENLILWWSEEFYSKFHCK